MGESELALVRKSRGHRDRHPPHRGAHQGADLQQLEPDRAAGRLGELGVSKPDPGVCCTDRAVGIWGWLA